MAPRKFMTIIIAALVAGAVLGSFGIANAVGTKRIASSSTVSTAAAGQVCVNGGTCTKAAGGTCPKTAGGTCAKVAGAACPKTAGGAASGTSACGMMGRGGACASAPTTVPGQ